MEVCSKRFVAVAQRVGFQAQNLFVVAGSSNRGATWDILGHFSIFLGGNSPHPDSLVQAELAREAELAKEAEAAKQAELAKKAKQAALDTDCS